MNSRLLKAKRVERGLRQIDLARELGITEKTMNHKECSNMNHFSADQMIHIADTLSLSLYEFDRIFFDGRLPKVY